MPRVVMCSAAFHRVYRHPCLLSWVPVVRFKCRKPHGPVVRTGGRLICWLLRYATGAGKSTLLDIITGRKSSVGGVWSGDVAINGVTLTPTELRRCVGYVTQDDVMLGTQTVREYLLWQARMRLPQHLSIQDRHARVRIPATSRGLPCFSLC